MTAVKDFWSYDLCSGSKIATGQTSDQMCKACFACVCLYSKVQYREDATCRQNSLVTESNTHDVRSSSFHEASMRFSLGEHYPKSDRLLPTGEVRSRLTYWSRRELWTATLAGMDDFGCRLNI